METHPEQHLHPLPHLEVLLALLLVRWQLLVLPLEVTPYALLRLKSISLRNAKAFSEKLGAGGTAILENGANVNRIDNNSMSILHYAVQTDIKQCDERKKVGPLVIKYSLSILRNLK